MNKYLSEFIGTFALVFCGTGAIIINEVANGTIGNTGIAITFGLIVMSMIYTFGEISGAHFNPAVSIGFWISGKLDKKEVLPYVLAQLLGAIFASVVLAFLFPENQNLGGTFPAGSNLQTFILEVFLSFFLMLVIISVSSGSKETGIMAGIAIGGVVLLEAMFAGPITGASMNPARSIGPALISGQFSTLWIYIFAPLLGASIAVLAYRFTKEQKKT